MSVNLTEYSHGAGCGCKIAPAILQQILASETPPFHHPQLLVGNETSDGMLIAVEPGAIDAFLSCALSSGLQLTSFGEMKSPAAQWVEF